MESDFKCIKLHIGKTCNENLCKDLFVDTWKLNVVENIVTGQLEQKESFGGQEKMKVKHEQVYLGDTISDDGKHFKNVEARRNKSLGIITQIMDILKSVFFGKYYFEVALVLRSSLLLSSLLLNSEAWVNLTAKDIRSLEQTDEILLSKILDCEANTSNVFKYLELGIYPVKFEIMKRKILFLHYLLNQEKSSMIFKVLQATRDNPVKNDFVKTCEDYLSALKINLSFEQLGDLSNWSVKKLVKEKTAEAAFNYLVEEKCKQVKISHIQYKELEIQDYLMEGNRNNDVAKLIFKARSMTLNIKTQKKWKYKDDICIGCGLNTEDGDEILKCKQYSDGENDEKISYSWFFSGNSSDMAKVANVLLKNLKKRDKIMEELT